VELRRRRSVTGPLCDHRQCSRFADCDAIGLGLSVRNQREGIGTLLIERERCRREECLQHTVCRRDRRCLGRGAIRRSDGFEVRLVLAADRVDGLEHRDLKPSP
jgi:hypothetical protein